MSEGDGMAEVTEGDREKAERVVDAYLSDGMGLSDLTEAIAAALAEEREKARAPFLALASELATVATHHHATVAGDAYADAADRIIAILEGTYR